MNLVLLLLGSAAIAILFALAIYFVTGHEEYAECVGVGIWLVMFFGVLIFGLPAFTALNVGIVFAVLAVIVLGSFIGSLLHSPSPTQAGDPNGDI